jgi:hypothetical protein
MNLQVRLLVREVYAKALSHVGNTTTEATWLRRDVIIESCCDGAAEVIWPWRVVTVDTHADMTRGLICI